MTCAHAESAQSCCRQNLAAASVPIQEWEEPMAPETSLLKGTVFPSLDMPFFAQNETKQSTSELPGRAALLNEIDRFSFEAYDLTLFLDTHPDCPEALCRFQNVSAKRKELLKQYAGSYGPLTLECAACQDSAGSFSWLDGPAPWEGGNI